MYWKFFLSICSCEGHILWHALYGIFLWIRIQFLPVFCRHFQTTDQKKFQDVWAMNEEQVRELVHSVLEADRIIHEHQLGLPWEPPNL